MGDNNTRTDIAVDKIPAEGEYIELNVLRFYKEDFSFKGYMKAGCIFKAIDPKADKDVKWGDIIQHHAMDQTVMDITYRILSKTEISILLLMET